MKRPPHHQKNNVYLLTLLIIAQFLFLSSCQSYKKVTYLQGENTLVAAAQELPGLKIQPKDQLGITVSYPEMPELAIPFNLTTVPSTQSTDAQVVSQPTLQAYTVKADGHIDFPVLGAVKVTGMTREQIETILTEQLKPHFKHTPIVNVTLQNFHISVLGEVNRPGAFTITNDRITVLEALAMAGDLTIHGRRDNIMLIREASDGTKITVSLNLNDKELLSSSYYYLQQNDVLYVQPNKAISRTSGITTNTTIWVTIIGSIMTLASLMVTILK